MTRPSYSMIDVLRQARGLPTADGHTVVTKRFTDDLIAELERLYGIEDAAVAVSECVVFGDDITTISLDPVDDLLRVVGVVDAERRGEMYRDITGLGEFSRISDENSRLWHVLRMALGDVELDTEAIAALCGDDWKLAADIETAVQRATTPPPPITPDLPAKPLPRKKKRPSSDGPDGL